MRALATSFTLRAGRFLSFSKVRENAHRAGDVASSIAIGRAKTGDRRTPRRFRRGQRRVHYIGLYRNGRFFLLVFQLVGNKRAISRAV